jgi:cytidyltransferase-like protein
MRQIVVTGGFDNLRSPQVRFLQEASRLGEVHVLLWSDDTVARLDGCPPKFPLAERKYFLEAIRYVRQVQVVYRWAQRDVLPRPCECEADVWVVDEGENNRARRDFCASIGLGYHVVSSADLQGWPLPETNQNGGANGRKKVIVTGCFDWLHSGHVRFFEEASRYGDLYVALGHDANLRLLKGEGHPLFSQEERRYMVQSIRYVKQAVITSGDGWMDAEPEIESIRPEIYLVNEDGDRPEKRLFCEEHGLEYVVLERTPRQGLPRRQSTDLRGF